MNLRRMISKSSLNSSSMKHREQFLNEKSKLIHEVELLKDSVKYLSTILKNQDEALITLSNDKDKLYLELKSVQRINRNLKQQLKDEREKHSKEKEHLIGEIMMGTINSDPNNNNLRFSNEKSHSFPDNKIESNFSMLQQELNIKDEVIYKICSKYMKVSYTKKSAQKRICYLQLQTDKMCKNIISLLQENQETFDKLIEKLLTFSKFSSLGKKYLHDLKSFAHLHYENMQLKIALLSHRTKDYVDEIKCKKCNSDANYATSPDGRIKNHLYYNGHLISLDRSNRLKRNISLLKSKSDSYLALNR